MNNKKIFSSKEYDNWLYRDGLLPEEKGIILKFLEKDKSTLEAGTASGRILFEMNKLGFNKLSGYDFISEYINAAQKINTEAKINFSVQDATKLDFKNESFNQLIYLQQIISTIEEHEMRIRALKESYRILEKGGTAIFSFLSFESKQKDRLYKLISPIIKFFRYFKSNKMSEQYIPWLKYTGKINFKALFDVGPYNYWYRIDEIINLLRETGFDIVYCGFPEDIINQRELDVNRISSINSNKGHLYIVCKKI